MMVNERQQLNFMDSLKKRLALWSSNIFSLIRRQTLYQARPRHLPSDIYSLTEDTDRALCQSHPETDLLVALHCTGSGNLVTFTE